MIAAVDLLFVDTAFASACSSNSPSTTNSNAPQNPSPGPGDDDCYCCSTHIVFKPSVPLLTVVEQVEVVSFALILDPGSADLQGILHPPRS